MVAMRVDVFKGLRPRVQPRLLPPGEGQVVENVRLGSGAFDVWRGLELDTALSDVPVTIHRMRNGGSPLWLTWDTQVDVARGPVPDDALERTYWTGEDEPRMTYTTIVGSTDPPDDYRVLGVPAPATAPTTTGDPLPEDSVSGEVTSGSWDTNVMKADFVNEDNLPVASVGGWQMSDGSGYETAGTVRVYNMDFVVGQEIRVASVVDTNTVTLEDANGQSYLAKTTEQSRATGGILHFRTDDTGTTRDGYFRFYVPNGIEVTIPTHGLEAGDIIRITSIPSTIALSLVQGGLTGSITLYGYESDNAGGTAATNTWPSAPISVAADGFWIAGARAYPFVDVWYENTGPASTNSFNIEGGFTFSLIERGGVPYEDVVSNIETRSYVYTFVTALGEEGPPSPPSDPLTVVIDSDVTVDGFDTPPNVSSDKIDITALRIYRAVTGTQDTDFLFVGEHPYTPPSAPSMFTDTVDDADLGELLQTTTWDPPPEDLEGIITLPNGVCAGFFGKTVCFSEPYYPHAWPPEYRQAVDHDIVGLGIIPNGVAILTVGPAYIAAGDHPSAMSLRHFTSSQACTEKLSIASTIDGVLYASPDGLAKIGASGFLLVTDAYVQKREWQTSFDPTNIRGFWHDGKYFGFMAAGGFIFDPSDDSIGLSTTDTTIAAGYLDAESDELFLVVEVAP